MRGGEGERGRRGSTNIIIDSWWYFKGENSGVSLWEPMPSVFPEGMGNVHENMGNMPLALHNRYFSPDNEYLSLSTYLFFLYSSSHSFFFSFVDPLKLAKVTTKISKELLFHH